MPNNPEIKEDIVLRSVGNLETNLEIHIFKIEAECEKSQLKAPSNELRKGMYN